MPTMTQPEWISRAQAIFDQHHGSHLEGMAHGPPLGVGPRPGGEGDRLRELAGGTFPPGPPDPQHAGLEGGVAEIARQVGISPGRVSQMRGESRASWAAYNGQGAA